MFFYGSITPIIKHKITIMLIRVKLNSNLLSKVSKSCGWKNVVSSRPY